MSRVNARLVYWIADLYEHADLTSAERDILVCVVVRQLDYGSGAGYCSAIMPTGSTGHSERTVRRALDKARKLGLIERTRRGHRRGDGSVAASEWQLAYPASNRPERAG